MISPFYDPMIAKIIIGAPTRDEAFDDLSSLERNPSDGNGDQYGVSLMRWLCMKMCGRWRLIPSGLTVILSH